MKVLATFFHQPKQVFLLSFVQMWNRFSHYGMRALLVLFMVNALGFTSTYAFGIFAVFCALVELGGVFGALLADKLLGLRRSILLGGWIIALGHLSLALGFFFPGLAFLIVGSSLFSTNITALMGKFYELEDTRRTAGFTLFYMGINIGALFATILCGLLATHFGWEYGFGLAAIGMVIANLTLLKYRSLLQGKGEVPSCAKKKSMLSLISILIGGGVLGILALLGQSITLPLLPVLAIGMAFVIIQGLKKKKIPFQKMCLTLIALLFFFAAEEQIGSSMVVFADQMTKPTLFGFSVSSSAILAMNPIIIILCGALTSSLARRIHQPFFRLFFPFLLAAGAFLPLALFKGLFPFSSLMAIVGVISFAELFIGPIAYSACSKVAVEANDPKVMGLVPIGFSLSALLGGGLSKGIAALGYTSGFFGVGCLLLASGAVLGIMHQRQVANKRRVM